MYNFINKKGNSLAFIPAREHRHIVEIKELFREYADSLNTDLCFQNFEEELKSLPGKYAPPNGLLILALVDGNAAGCVCARKLETTICEMKRLYVRDKFRGLGLGKLLIDVIIQESKKLGYLFMRLDTLPSMIKAQHLYREFGFYEIEPYVFNPIEGTKYMELNLNKNRSLF